MCTRGILFVTLILSSFAEAKITCGSTSSPIGVTHSAGCTEESPGGELQDSRSERAARSVGGDTGKFSSYVDPVANLLPSKNSWEYPAGTFDSGTDASSQGNKNLAAPRKTPIPRPKYYVSLQPSVELYPERVFGSSIYSAERQKVPWGPGPRRFVSGTPRLGATASPGGVRYVPKPLDAVPTPPLQEPPRQTGGSGEEEEEEEESGSEEYEAEEEARRLGSDRVPPGRPLTEGTRGSGPRRDVLLGFVPFQIYSQVRRTDAAQRLPQSAALLDAETLEEIINAPRLREVLRDNKKQEVYEEEGYEDAGYDHGGYNNRGSLYKNYDRTENSQRNPPGKGQSVTRYNRRVGNVPTATTGSNVNIDYAFSVPGKMDDARSKFSIHGHRISPKRVSQPRSKRDSYGWHDPTTRSVAEGKIINSRNKPPGPISFPGRHTKRHYSPVVPQNFITSKPYEEGPWIPLIPQELGGFVHATPRSSSPSVQNYADSSISPHTPTLTLPDLIYSPSVVKFPSDNHKIVFESVASRPSSKASKDHFSKKRSSSEVFNSYFPERNHSLAGDEIREASTSVVDVQPRSHGSAPLSIFEIQATGTRPSESTSSATPHKVYDSVERGAGNRPSDNYYRQKPLTSLWSSSSHDRNAKHPSIPRDIEPPESDRESRRSTIAVPNGSPKVENRQLIAFPKEDYVSPTKYVESLTLAHFKSTRDTPLYTHIPSRSLVELVAHLGNQGVFSEGPRVDGGREDPIGMELRNKRTTQTEGRRNSETTYYYDSDKYPFFKNPTFPFARDSALRYALDPRQLPKKTFNGMEFYESKDKSKYCEELNSPQDIIPEREEDGEWNKDPQRDGQQMHGLGGFIQCFKEKYFGKDPFDNPFFKEKVIDKTDLFVVSSDIDDREQLKVRRSVVVSIRNKTKGEFIDKEEMKNESETSSLKINSESERIPSNRMIYKNSTRHLDNINDASQEEKTLHVYSRLKHRRRKKKHGHRQPYYPTTVFSIAFGSYNPLIQRPPVHNYNWNTPYWSGVPYYRNNAERQPDSSGSYTKLVTVQPSKEEESLVKRSVKWEVSNRSDERRQEPRYRDRRHARHADGQDEIISHDFEQIEDKEDKYSTQVRESQATTLGPPISLEEFKRRMNIPSPKPSGTEDLGSKSTAVSVIPLNSEGSTTESTLKRLDSGKSRGQVKFPDIKFMRRQQFIRPQRNSSYSSTTTSPEHTTTGSTTSTVKPPRLYQPRRSYRKGGKETPDVFAVSKRRRPTLSTSNPFDLVETETEDDYKNPRKNQKVERRRVVKKEVLKRTYIPEEESSRAMDTTGEDSGFSFSRSEIPPRSGERVANTRRNDSLIYSVDPTTGEGRWEQRRENWRRHPWSQGTEPLSYTTPSTLYTYPVSLPALEDDGEDYRKGFDSVEEGHHSPEGEDSSGAFRDHYSARWRRKNHEKKQRDIPQSRKAAYITSLLRRAPVPSGYSSNSAEEDEDSGSSESGPRSSSSEEEEEDEEETGRREGSEEESEEEEDDDERVESHEYSPQKQDVIPKPKFILDPSKRKYFYVNEG